MDGREEQKASMPPRSGSSASRGTPVDWINLWAGLAIVALGAVGLMLVWRLPVETSLQMGPGYVPRLLCFILMALGALLAVRGRRGPASRPEVPKPRPLGLVLAAILVFMLTIDRFGLVVSVPLTVGVAALAGTRSRFRETTVLAVVLTAFSALVFVKGIGLPIPLTP